MGTGLAAWLVLAGLYLLLAGEASVDEDAAAVLTASAGLACVLLVRGVTDRPMVLHASWHRVIARPAGALAPDSWHVGRALARAAFGRGSSGRLTWQAFHAGGPNPDDRGRLALATLALSLAPNGYVLDRPGGADALLMHRLAASAAEPDPVWPL